MVKSDVFNNIEFFNSNDDAIGNDFEPQIRDTCSLIFNKHVIFQFVPRNMIRLAHRLACLLRFGTLYLIIVGSSRFIRYIIYGYNYFFKRKSAYMVSRIYYPTFLVGC